MIALNRADKLKQYGRELSARGRKHTIRGLLAVSQALFLWLIYEGMSYFSGSNTLGERRIPSLSTVIQATDSQVVAEIFSASVVTSINWGFSLILAVAIGTIAGAILGSNKRLTQATEFVVNFLRSLPATILALYALLVADTFVTRNLPSIYIVTFLVLYYVSRHVDVYTHSRATYLTRMGASRTFVFRNVYVPELRHAIGVAVRQATPVALLVTVSTELIFGGNLGKPGLGQIVYDYMSGPKGVDPKIVLVVILLGSMGYLGTRGATGLESRLKYDRIGDTTDARLQHRQPSFLRVVRKATMATISIVMGFVANIAMVLYRAIPIAKVAERWLSARGQLIVNSFLILLLMGIAIVAFHGRSVDDIYLSGADLRGGIVETFSERPAWPVHAARLAISALMLLSVFFGFFTTIYDAGRSDRIAANFSNRGVKYVLYPLGIYAVRVLLLSFFIYYALHSVQTLAFVQSGRGGLEFATDSLFEILRRAVTVPLGPEVLPIEGAGAFAAAALIALAGARYLTVTFLIGTFAILLEKPSKSGDN